MRTIIPFHEHQRINNVTVIDEFLEEVKKCSDKYGVPVTDFRAKYELAHSEEDGWFLIAEVWTEKPINNHK